MRNAAIEATAPTDRSMPPVSIAIVWQPARIARGVAARIVVASQLPLTIPGFASSRTATRTARRMRSGMIG